MKKERIWLFLILLISGIFSVYLSSASAEIDKAYQCVDDLVKETSITLDEAIFSALAGIRNNKIMSVIDNERSNAENCWPKSSCNVKTTAQVAIVYDHLGRDTTNIIKWLMSKNATVSGFTWYLQVTDNNNEPAECIANYDGSDYSFEIDDEMRLSGNPGACLSVDSSRYRLKIANNCLDKEFSIKCNGEDGFKINLLYEKSTGGTLYVSSRTESGSADSWKSLKINAKCFKEGTSCNYESSLWAVSALYANGVEYEPFLPYLRVLEEDNERLFPSSFLNYIEGGDHYSRIIELKNERPQDRAYWDVGGNRYYDTALAMLALGGCDESGEDFCTNADLKGAANYLLDEQTEKGCWNNNNLKDTAFLLYAGWPKGGSGGGTTIPEGAICEDVDGICRSNCTAGEESSNAVCGIAGEVCCVEESSGSTPTNVCENAGHYCIDPSGSDSAAFRCLEAGGEVKDEFLCSNFAIKCCSVEVRQATCAEQQGIICQTNEECSGSPVPSVSGACCIGACEPIQEFECTEDSDCANDEECLDNECVPFFEPECSIDSDCAKGESCSNGSCVTGGRSSVWIWLLIILIILVLTAIIFRNKIRMWWFNRKKKTKPGIAPPPQGPMRFGPGGPPGGRMMPPRFIPQMPPRGRAITPSARPIPNQRPQPRRPSEKDKEMDETLKKLKKMSE